jgi:hypothetical protein
MAVLFCGQNDIGLKRCTQDFLQFSKALIDLLADVGGDIVLPAGVFMWAPLPDSGGAGKSIEAPGCPVARG